MLAVLPFFNLNAAQRKEANITSWRTVIRNSARSIKNLVKLLHSIFVSLFLAKRGILKEKFFASMNLFTTFHIPLQKHERREKAEKELLNSWMLHVPMLHYISFSSLPSTFFILTTLNSKWLETWESFLSRNVVFISFWCGMSFSFWWKIYTNDAWHLNCILSSSFCYCFK